MIRILASAIVLLVSNTIALIVGAIVLDGMGLSGAAFLIAVLIFTGIEMLVSPLIRQTALTKAPVLLGSTALVASMVALIITAAISDGLSISGLGTWAMAIILVWVVGLIAQLLLPFVIFKKVLRARNERGPA